MARKSTTDAVYTIGILMESFRNRKKDLHIIYLNLEKAFEHSQIIPECYINLINEIYDGIMTRIRSPAGTSKEFHVKVKVQQGSTLSSVHFNLVMNHK